MLHRLSNALSDLYRVADEAPVQDCIEALFQSAQALVRFDGAAISCSSHRQPSSMFEAGNPTYGCATGVPEEYAGIAERDPVACMFHGDGMLPLACHCPQAYNGHATRALNSLWERHRVQHILLTGTPAEDGRPASWMALLRHAPKPFRQSDADYFSATWPHLLRCLHTARKRALAALERQRGEGLALLRSASVVEVANAAFQSLCKEEWPGNGGPALPEHVSSSLRRDGEYIGRGLRLRLFDFFGFSACAAEPRTTLDLLTRAERVVALHYAEGLSHKEIARELAISDNTVKTHLSHVFDKLGIHRKAELILRLMAADAQK